MQILTRGELTSSFGDSLFKFAEGGAEGVEVVPFVVLALGLEDLAGLFGPVDVEGVAHAVLKGEGISVVVVLQGVTGEGMAEQIRVHHAQRVTVGLDLDWLPVG